MKAKTAPASVGEKGDVPAMGKPLEYLYVGPTLPKLGLIHNVVYAGLPEEAKGAIESGNFFLLRLFIEPKGFAVVERQITERSGFIWDAYKRALRFVKEV